MLARDAITSGVCVQLYRYPAHFPFLFAWHYWFEVRDGAGTARYEVLFRKRAGEGGSKHLVRDALPAGQGIELVPFCGWLHWPGTLVRTYTGDVAHELASIIRASMEIYPHRDRYALLGPNSNTYVQWVLDQVPGSSTTLPLSAFGARYRAR